MSKNTTAKNARTATATTKAAPVKANKAKPTPAPAAPAPVAVAPVKAPKLQSKIGRILELLDAARTPAPLTIREIMADLTARHAAGLLTLPANDLTPTGAAKLNEKSTISSINAMAVPSWGRHEGKLFRYALTTQQGADVVNPLDRPVQGIAPGARVTNTTLAHAFGPSAKAPSVMTPAEFAKISPAPVSPRAEISATVEAATVAAKAAAKLAKQAATPAPVKGAPKASAPAKGAPSATKAPAPVVTAPRKRAAAAPVK